MANRLGIPPPGHAHTHVCIDGQTTQQDEQRYKKAVAMAEIITKECNIMQ